MAVQLSIVFFSIIQSPFLLLLCNRPARNPLKDILGNHCYIRLDWDCPLPVLFRFAPAFLPSISLRRFPVSRRGGGCRSKDGQACRSGCRRQSGRLSCTPRAIPADSPKRKRPRRFPKGERKALWPHPQVRSPVCYSARYVKKCRRRAQGRAESPCSRPQARNPVSPPGEKKEYHPKGEPHAELFV